MALDGMPTTGTCKVFGGAGLEYGGALVRDTLRARGESTLQPAEPAGWRKESRFRAIDIMIWGFKAWVSQRWWDFCICRRPRHYGAPQKASSACKRYVPQGFEVPVLVSLAGLFFSLLKSSESPTWWFQELSGNPEFLEDPGVGLQSYGPWPCHASLSITSNPPCKVGALGGIGRVLAPKTQGW